MSTSHNLGEVDLRINGPGGNLNYTPGTLGWFRRDTSGSINVVAVDTTTLVAAGVWQHVAAVFDGSNYQIYVNGTLQPVTVQTDDDVGDAGPNNTIGNFAGVAESFNGLIDEAQIFNRGLSAAEIGAIYNAGTFGLCPQALFARPTLMGVSISNTPGSADGTGSAELLVHLATDSSKKFILSASHILGNMGPSNCPNTAEIGTKTLQPGTVDGGTDPQDDVGTVANFVHLYEIGTGMTNHVDAAISKIDPSKASSDIFGIGVPNPAEMDAFPGEIVVKAGRTTAVTVGTVKFVNQTKTNFTPCGAYKYDGTIVISSTGKFSDFGDSGSGILDSATLTPVGVLFGGNLLGTSTLASPIKSVDKALNICPDGPFGSGAGSPGQLCPTLNYLGETRDSLLARLKEIQARHQEELLSQPGVDGIGIGLDENGRDLAFYVEVTKRTAELGRALPEQLEGVPVRLMESDGPFVAF